jgi:hypothetical protein
MRRIEMSMKKAAKFWGIIALVFVVTALHIKTIMRQLSMEIPYISILLY